MNSNMKSFLLLGGISVFIAGMTVEYFVINYQMDTALRYQQAEPTPQDVPQEPIEALRKELSTLKTTETLEPEEVPEKASEPVIVKTEPVRVRPSQFSHFLAEFEVVVKKEESESYVQRQAKELRSLVRTIPTVKSVKVVRIRGGVMDNGKVSYHEIKTE